MLSDRRVARLPLSSRPWATALFAAALASPPAGAQETGDSAARADEAELSPVVVTATRDEAETAFKAARSDTATRSGNDLLDVPQSLTIVTGKVIESQQATSVEEALRNVSGIIVRESGGGPSSYLIRGFGQTSQLANGLASPFATSIDVNAVERIEVLKGPQAILSGAESLGGGVNVVTKKPQAERVRQLALQYGTYGDRQVSGDLSGVLGQDPRLTYRLLGTWADARRNDAGFQGRENLSITPSLRWKDAATDLTVGASAGRRFTPKGRHTFAQNGRIRDVPGMLLGNRGDGIELDSRSVQYALEQRLARGLVLVSRLQHSRNDLDLRQYGVQFPAGGQYAFVPTNDDTRYTTTSGDHYLRAEFATGPLAHKLSVGLNHTRQKSARKSYEGPLQMVDPYASQPHPFPDLTHDRHIGGYTDSSSQTGYYAHDLIRLGDWNLHAGLRHTRYRTGPTRTELLDWGVSDEVPRNTLSKTTPAFGVAYNLTPTASLYAAYAQGFLPQFPTTRVCADGSAPPMQTRNRELGAKLDLLDRQLALTASLFELQQTNMLQYESADNCVTPREAQRVRGAELDVQGRLLPGWNLIFNYTYNQMRDVGEPSRFYAAQPKHAASLWTTYDFQQQALAGWGLGLGVTARSRTRGGTTGSAIAIGGSAQTDASVFYRRGKWAATLGVKNVFDRVFHGYTTSDFFVPVEAGRTAVLTVRRSFD